jgi:hypothetical protein
MLLCGFGFLYIKSIPYISYKMICDLWNLFSFHPLARHGQNGKRYLLWRFPLFPFCPLMKSLCSLADAGTSSFYGEIRKRPEIIRPF